MDDKKELEKIFDKEREELHGLLDILLGVCATRSIYPKRLLLQNIQALEHGSVVPGPEMDHITAGFVDGIIHACHVEGLSAQALFGRIFDSMASNDEHRPEGA